MAIKGEIKGNHVPISSYDMIIAGMPPMTPITLAIPEEVLETTDLPDRTRRSQGNTKTATFTATFEEHHTVEQLALEAWYLESQKGAPTYLKPGVINGYGIDGSIRMAYTLQNCFPFRRKPADRDMTNESDEARTEWEFSCDEIVPVPM